MGWNISLDVGVVGTHYAEMEDASFHGDESNEKSEEESGVDAPGHGAAKLMESVG